MDIIIACIYTLLGTGFTFGMTACGAATVFFIKGKQSEKMQSLFLGFASGVMLAASVWSLLIPALQKAEVTFNVSWMPVAGGFLLGGILFCILDAKLFQFTNENRKSLKLKGVERLFTAITLHNIPEGMAVGLSFALAVQDSSYGSIATSIFLAIGIGVQNFPEGAAVALPLHQRGISKKKAFTYGSLSGIVEPIGGIMTVLLAGMIQYLLPCFLAFAAGAMVYVVVDELIPEAKSVKSNIGTVGAMMGFVLMMILDVALG